MQITKVSIKNLANLVVGYQYDHKKQAFQFVDVPHPELNQYLKITVEWQEQPLLLPLTDNLYVVGQPFTLHSGFFKAQLMVKDSDGNYIANSHLFNLEVSKSIDPGEKYENIDPNLEIVYDEMKDLINTVNQKLVNGEFNGEDGFSPIVGLNDETDGVVISVTDKDGQKSAKIKHGINGINGQSAYEIAVKNGFKGSELEWLESLRYDHSDEFQALASKVHKDAEQSSQNAKNAETHATQALESATQANQSKNDAFISAQKAQTAEAHAKTSETNAKESENKAKESAGSAKLSEDNSKQSEQLAQQSAEQIQASAEQIEQNKLDIEDLRNNPVIDEKVLEKLAIKDKAQGNPCVISDSADWQMQGLNIYGQSEQASTTGAQLLSLDMIVKKLPFSDKGITFSDNGDGGIKVTGTATGTVTLFFNDMINNLEDGETYSYNSDTELGKLQIKYNDGTPIDYIKTVTVNKSKTISIEPYLQYASGNIINKVIYPMLNIGNSVKPREPYTGGNPSPSPDYPQEIISKEVSEIKVSGKNLIGTERNYINYSSGAGYIHRKEVEVTLPYKPTNETFGIGYIIPCNEGETYTISVTNPNENAVVGITEYKSVEEMDNYLNNIGLIQPKLNLASYVAKSNGFLLCFIAGKWTDGKTTLHECTESELLQVEIGTVATSYGPYKEQTVTLSQPITLRGIPVSTGGNVTIDGKQYVSDEINSNIEYVNKVKRITLDGSEKWFTWGANTNGNIGFYYYPNTLKNDSNIKGNRCISNYLPYSSDAYNGAKVGVNVITGGNATLTYIIVSLQQSELVDVSSNELAIKSFKEFLVNKKESGVPFEIYCQLLEPIITPLSESDQQAIKELKSYYYNTVIQAGTFTEATYVVYTKLYIDKLLQPLNTVQSQLLKLESEI